MVKLADMNLEQLKAAYYDTAMSLDKMQENMKIIKDEIEKRNVEVTK